ncbi:hypothetical protein ADIAL_1607 [Alkalibacterium sp. AK22]|nr:hypothetical protein ADIAL_1607 [Alkalibacterium sp. AK22]
MAIILNVRGTERRGLFNSMNKALSGSQEQLIEDAQYSERSSIADCTGSHARKQF